MPRSWTLLFGVSKAIALMLLLVTPGDRFPIAMRTGLVDTATNTFFDSYSQMWTLPPCRYNGINTNIIISLPFANGNSPNFGNQGLANDSVGEMITYIGLPPLGVPPAPYFANQLDVGHFNTAGNYVAIPYDIHEILRMAYLSITVEDMYILADHLDEIGGFSSEVSTYITYATPFLRISPSFCANKSSVDGTLRVNDGGAGSWFADAVVIDPGYGIGGHFEQFMTQIYSQSGILISPAQLDGLGSLDLTSMVNSPVAVIPMFEPKIFNNITLKLQQLTIHHDTGHTARSNLHNNVQDKSYDPVIFTRYLSLALCRLQEAVLSTMFHFSYVVGAESSMTFLGTQGNVAVVQRGLLKGLEAPSVVQGGVSTSTFGRNMFMNIWAILFGDYPYSFNGYSAMEQIYSPRAYTNQAVVQFARLVYSSNFLTYPPDRENRVLHVVIPKDKFLQFGLTIRSLRPTPTLIRAALNLSEDQRIRMSIIDDFRLEHGEGVSLIAGDLDGLEVVTSHEPMRVSQNLDPRLTEGWRRLHNVIREFLYTPYFVGAVVVDTIIKDSKRGTTLFDMNKYVFSFKPAVFLVHDAGFNMDAQLPSRFSADGLTLGVNGFGYFCPYGNVPNLLLSTNLENNMWYRFTFAENVSSFIHALLSGKDNTLRRRVAYSTLKYIIKNNFGNQISVNAMYSLKSVSQLYGVNSDAHTSGE